MYDSVTLEDLGIATAAIVTTVFVNEAKVQLEALGAPHLEFAVITHPLSTLTEAQIRARAEEAAPQLHRILLGLTEQGDA